MTQDVLDQEVAEPSAEELQQQEQAAFEAGFSQASGDEPPPVEAPAEVTPAPDVKAEVDGSADPEPEAEDPVLPEFGMTAKQVREYLAEVSDLRKYRLEADQHRDRLYGMMGSMKQQLQEISQRGATPARLNIAKEKFKRLSAEYPEMAALLAEDLSEAVGFESAAVAPQAAPAPVAQQTPAIDLAEVERRYEQKLEAKLLAREHPDWQEVAASADFKLWKDGLQADQRQVLETTWDSSVISQGLTAFKQWHQQQTQRSTSKKQRLERAIQPSGIPATTDTATDYDAFLAGFAQARGIK